MPFNKSRDLEWRERMKQKRREQQAQRRKARAADPRVQAMKQVIKERRRAAYEKAEARRKALAEAQKQSRRARKAEQRAERDAALLQQLRPATSLNDENENPSPPQRSDDSCGALPVAVT